MTREVAKREIESLDYYLQNHTNDYSEESHTAMVMAIKALEQESCDNAVSRQAALDAMYELCNTGETLKENPWRDNPHIDAITDAINNLPSVNPQVSCGDAISRQAVLDAIEDDNRNGMWSCFVSDDDAQKFKTVIKDLPSVKQEPKTEQEDDYFRKIVEVAISQLRADRDRLEDELAKREQESKTGHWMIVHRKGIYAHLVCDKCLSNAPYDCRTNYCPNCGAKMIEPQERSEE